MNKFIIFLCFSVVFAAESPFSRIRTAAYDSEGIPSEEVHDISICLERNPTLEEKQKYEEVIGYYADGIYEATNGANFIGNVIIYSGAKNCSKADIVWEKEGVWPAAGADNIGVSDAWLDEGDKMGNEKDRLEFGIALTHETIHLRYALDDEYAKTASTEHEVSLLADTYNDAIVVMLNNVDNEEALYRFKTWIQTTYTNGNPVRFFAIKDGRVPDGLDMGPVPPGRNDDFGHFIIDYPIIDQVDASSLELGYYSFNLKDGSGRRIDIKDAGDKKWGFDRPDNVSVAHSIMNWDGEVAKSSKCGSDNIQWQWANLSTSFNVNPSSPLGICCRDADGNLLSAWDILTRNPKTNLIDGKYPGDDFRYWYKSLLKKKPKESDVYRAKSFLMNYDENTGKTLPGYAVWVYDDACGHAKTYDLPYMRVELAGRNPSEYRAETHKHLNIQWVDESTMEVIILIDRSLSMNYVYKDSYGDVIKKNDGKPLLKIDMARMAAKFIAQGVTSLSWSSSSANQTESNVVVGVYAFDDVISSVYPFLNRIPDLDDIYTNIDAIRPQNATALFDALYSALSYFSFNSASKKLLYVISDGLDVSSTHTKDDVIRKSKNKDIAIHTFAYGDLVDAELLSAMAEETNGTFYEDDANFPIEITDVVSTALSSFPDNEQIKAAVIAANQSSSEVFVPRRTKYAKIYGSYSGSAVSSPIEITSKSGATLPALIKNNASLNKNYFVAEIDSLTLANLSEPFVKVKNKLNDRTVGFRIIATNEYHNYSLNVKLNPSGTFKWPSQKNFKVSVRSKNGFLADVDVTGKLIDPDGVVQTITMHDDGANGDFRAGDGIFFAALPTINKNGSYQWEISASNKNGRAHTTRVGTSLPNSIC